MKLYFVEFYNSLSIGRAGRSKGAAVVMAYSAQHAINKARPLVEPFISGEIFGLAEEI